MIGIMSLILGGLANAVVNWMVLFMPMYGGDQVGQVLQQVEEGLHFTATHRRDAKDG